MSDRIEKIHKTQLEILEAFKSICKKHGLRYYAIGGTLIGVHRHKGFIPWDDDIDLGMPRPDFDKFVALQKEYPKAGFERTKETAAKIAGMVSPRAEPDVKRWA